MTEYSDQYIYTDAEWRKAARTALDRSGWTQAKLAAKVGDGLTQGMLSHVLLGRTNPSPHIAKICELLSLPIPIEHEWGLAGRALLRHDRKLFKLVLEMVRAAQLEAARNE